MDPRVNFITVAVADVAASRRFYVDGLGWPVSLDAPGVLMIRLGTTLVLSLWSEDEFEAEVGPLRRGSGIAGFTLAHNMPTDAGVDDVLSHAQSAGATDVQLGRAREWGGYSGYFADPDGVRWEIAHNPTTLGVELMVASGLLPDAR